MKYYILNLVKGTFWYHQFKDDEYFTLTKNFKEAFSFSSKNEAIEAIENEEAFELNEQRYIVRDPKPLNYLKIYSVLSEDEVLVLDIVK